MIAKSTSFPKKIKSIISSIIDQYPDTTHKEVFYDPTFKHKTLNEKQPIICISSSDCSKKIKLLNWLSRKRKHSSSSSASDSSSLLSASLTTTNSNSHHEYTVHSAYSLPLTMLDNNQQQNEYQNSILLLELFSTELKELYINAKEEIFYAFESQGSIYYEGDKLTAETAFDLCEIKYNNVIQALDGTTNIIKFKFQWEAHIAQLKNELHKLPLVTRSIYD